MRKVFGKGFGFSSGAEAGGGSIDAAMTATVAYLPGIPLSTNYPAGTTIEAILRDLIAPYTIPAFSNLDVVLSPDDTYIEVGREVDVVSASWAVTNDSEGNPPQNMSLAGDGFNKAVTGTSSTAEPASTTQRLTAGNQTWTLSGEDKDAVALTPIINIRAWRFRYWFGATNAADPVDAGSATALALALQQSQLLASRAANFTCTADNDAAGNYTWIVYRASFLALTSIIQNGALPVLTAFTFIGAFDVTNAFGITTSYNFYKSNADAAFANGTTLAIS